MGCFARVYNPRRTTDVSIQKNPDKGDLRYIKLIQAHSAGGAKRGYSRRFRVRLSSGPVSTNKKLAPSYPALPCPIQGEK